MAIFDFNSNVLFGHILSIPAWKGVTDVFGANRFLATHGLSSQTRIQQVCAEIPRQLPSPKVFLLRSIFLHGLRSAYLPRKSPRDRNMFARLTAQTLSRRDSDQSRSKYPRRSQRKQRLADLLRFCSRVDPKSKRPELLMIHEWIWQVKCAHSLGKTVEKASPQRGKI